MLYDNIFKTTEILQSQSSSTVYILIQMNVADNNLLIYLIYLKMQYNYSPI